jgi:hypothetical protein
MKSEGQKWLAIEPQHSTNNIMTKRTFHCPQPKVTKHGMTSVVKPVFNLDKALSTIRHQGIIKNGQKATNPIKTFLRCRHRVEKDLAKTCFY